MKTSSRSTVNQEKLREKLIGLGEHSFRKSYYPELQKRISDLERFKALLDLSNDVIFLLNSAGSFIYVNQAACLDLGYCGGELLGMKVYDILPTEEKDIIGPVFRGEKDSEIIETMVSDIQGRPFPFELNMRHVRFENTGYVIAVGRDVTERKRNQEAVQESLLKLQNMTISIINAISKVVEMRDPYTAGHQRHVSQLARAIALELGFSEEQAEWIRIAGLIHDVGKLSVPAEILSKPGRLNSLDFEIIKLHPAAGYEIVKLIDFPWPVAEVAHQHQERIDGSGYPRGLKGEEICIESRIVSVADVVEAMTFPRPYRPVIGLQKALEDIRSGKDILYYTPAVEACLKLFREKRFTFDAPANAPGKEPVLV